MNLKSLDISGFKSFADRTSIHFGDGMTAVVGPNGSGKSNIFDAIRWVLGEQSAKTLRGARMEDVIFSGSEGRRGVGLAEVSLTLDNSSGRLPLPFQEVTITRRIYRSGESEYLLNKTQCRHKDIQELLMDTGVGKEAHAIIGQGKIDAILSTRAEERRSIFEDAAGVTKFRVRLQEATRKLEETELNLLRVQDVILELDRQLGPLEVAAEAARVHKEHTRTLRKAERRLIVGRYANRRTAFSTQSDAMNALSDQLAGAEGTQANADNALQACRLELDRLDLQISEAQQSLWEITSGMDRTQERIKANETLCTETGEILDRLRAEAEELAVRLAGVTEEFAATTKLSEGLRSQVDLLSGELEGLEGTLGRSQTDHETIAHDLERLRAEAIEALSEASRKRNLLKGLDVEREMSVKRGQEIDGVISRLNVEVLDVVDGAMAVSTRRDSTFAGIRDSEATLVRLKEQSETVAAGIKGWDAEERRLSRELETKAVRRRILTDLSNSYEGFQHGVKAILTDFARTPGGKGIVGTIADLVTVPKEYERAMDIALGAAVQNIIATDADTAKAAIGYLKERKAGRVTFLPLDLVRGGRIGAEEIRGLGDPDGILGVAVDLVGFDKAYSRAFEQLLGRTLIARDMESAIRVSRMNGSRYRIVTLGGDVLNAGGSMTGGQDNRSQTSLLSRKRELEELRKSEEELKDALSQLRILKAEAESEAAGLSDGISTLTGERNALISQLAELDRELAYHARERERLDIELARARSEGSNIEGSVDDIGKRAEVLKTEISLLDERREECESGITGLQECLKAGQLERDGLSEKAMAVRLELASRKQSLEQCQRDSDRLRASIADISSKRDICARRRDQSMARLEELAMERLKDDTFVKGGTQDKGSLEEDLIRARNRREAEGKRFTELESASRTYARIVGEIRARLHSSEISLARLEVEMEDLGGQLIAVFEEDPESIGSDDSLLPAEERALESEITQERNFLMGLGDVNILAEEELVRTRERRDFLFTQREDLVQAEQGLRAIIEETQETAKIKFMETFTQIQDEFLKVFTRLFQGGSASLRLTDPNDVLGTGIEIHVQPPGKKLQNLSLLSGGERALAAIAVLFAVLKVRPNPFCVMDEIDAALDEVNVGRFAELLRECTGSSQFIIVTHRKGTMRVADRLYGVTMEDSGVSKVLSLDLQEATA